MSEHLITVRIPLDEAIKMRFKIDLNIDLIGSPKKVSDMDLNGAEYVLELNYFGEAQAISQIVGNDFKSVLYEEDMGGVNMILFDMPHYSICTIYVDPVDAFKEKCKYPFEVS